MTLSPDASYLLSGGMGALGLVTAQALAEEGAKSLLLMSRRGDEKLEGCGVDLVLVSFGYVVASVFAFSPGLSMILMEISEMQLHMYL